MPRNKPREGYVQFKVNLPKSLVDELRALAHDDYTKRPAYGLLSRLTERVLRENWKQITRWAVEMRGRD